MAFIDLDTFIKKARGSKMSISEWVIEPGFNGLYVRYAKRVINGKMRRTLDLANIIAKKPGAGAFTRLMDRLKKDYPRLTLYVEAVLTGRFAYGLTHKFGFVRDPLYTHDRNYYKLPDRLGRGG